MNQEPVGWILETELEFLKKGSCGDILPYQCNDTDIPLYTHPMRDLTDEEIWDWFKENTALEKESALMIARAILKKANEK